MQGCGKGLSIMPVLARYACSTPAPPADAGGHLPQNVLEKACRSIVAGDYADARAHFGANQIEESMTSKDVSFADYARSQTEGWKLQWLTTKVMGNDHNQDVGRVKIFPDEGKGAGDRARVVQDLHGIDGAWKIVLWGHYPTT